MNFRKILATAALAASIALPGAAKAVVLADIVFIIDNSLSMGNDIADVKARIGDFNAAMVNNGIDAQYGLVRVGGPNPGGHFLQDLVDFSTYTAAMSPFQLLTANAGNPESGSVGVNVALGSTTFRMGSVKNLILITDEDDDSSLADFMAADAALGANDALFNYIGSLNAGNTQQRYQVLADNHGGIGFEIADFRNAATADAFFDNFVDTKVQEILISAPEPSAIGLFGIALVGLGIAARRRKAG